MPGLIDALKVQHSAILARLDALPALIGEPVRIGEELLRLKGILLEHHGREDDELYPMLLRYPAVLRAKSAQLEALLSVIGPDMMLVSKTAIDFIDQHAGNAAGQDFRRDLGAFTASLRRRIANEERLIFPEVEKLGLARG